MFYTFAYRFSAYGYVYDDIDKSVEYVDLNAVRKAGIDLTSIISMEVVSDVKRLKLKYIGFTEFGNSIRFNLCRYSIDDVEIRMSVLVSMHGLVYCIFDFWKNCDLFSVYCAKNIGGYLSVADIGSVINDGKTSSIHLNIPVKMMDYLLSLWSSRDFNGIMRSFSNLFGKNIHKIVKSLYGKNIEVLSWE